MVLGWLNLHLGISQNWVTPHQIAFHILFNASVMFHGSPIKNTPRIIIKKKTLDPRWMVFPLL